MNGKKEQDVISLKKRNREIRKQINLISYKPRINKAALYCGNVKY